VEGGLDGHLLLILPNKSASLLVSKLLSDSIEIRVFTDFEYSTLAEVGNIMAGSFMNAISDLTQLRSQLSVPAVTIDMASAVMDVCLLTAPEQERKTLLIETNISQGDNEIDAHILLVPEPQAMRRLLTSLGC
jgi:chemotaxis protein CheC